jgi:excisionase family DNA binding protein
MNDSNEFVSTGEVARLAGVGPSAVKRWADGGQLRCALTAGGHRRFERAEVERFLRRPPAGAPRAGIRALGDPWLAGLLGARDALGLEGLLLSERARLGAWWQVAEEAGAALGRLGNLWRAGEVSVVEEHLASERLARALARVAEAIPIGSIAPRALLACADGDDHTLGLALVELVLREAGWATLWAGRRLPTAELAAAVGQGRVALLAVSASEASSDAAGLRGQADQLGRACRVAGLTLVLGGGGRWPERPRYGVRLRTLEPLHRLAVAERERMPAPGLASR